MAEISNEIKITCESYVKRLDVKESSTFNHDGNHVQYGSVSTDKQLLISTSKPNRLLRAIQILKSMTIEPVIFCFMFSFVLYTSCLTNMMMDKSCLFYFNYTKDVCDNLSNYPDEKTNVEIRANSYVSYINAMNLLGALSMTFIAPWSDKYGRKPPLYIAFLGLIISSIGNIICIIKFESDLYFLILARVPAELFDGFICVLTIIFSLASEVSTPEMRTFKYSIVEMAMGLGMSLGGFAGGIMYRYYGYLHVYVFAMSLHVIGLLWTILFVPETTGLGNILTWREKLRDFLTMDNLTRGINASLRHRENKGRTILLLFFLSMCIVVFSYESLGSIGYVYAHHIYNWDPMDYQTVNTIFTLIQMVVLVITVPLLTRVLKVADYALGIVGILSMMAKNTLIGLAQYQVYLYYLGYVLGCMSPFSNLIVRAGISKIVDKDELGRVFSFLATCESIVPMLGTLVIAKVFNATINIFPSVTYLLTVGLFLIPLGTFIFAYREQRKIKE